MMDIRDRLLHAAAKVYSETGYRGTTTRRIAQVAGVNEITLFRHFGTKKALVHEALKLAYRNAAPVVLGEPVDPVAELNAWAWSIYRHWYQGREMISRVMGDLIEHPVLAPDICEEPGCEHAMLSRYLDRMRELGLARGQFHSDAAAGLLLGGVFTHSIWRDHFEDESLPSPEVVIQQYVALLLSAVGAQGAPAVNTNGTTKETA
jgi:AcrR family transcriptional regulator